MTSKLLPVLFKFCKFIFRRKQCLNFYLLKKHFCHKEKETEPERKLNNFSPQHWFWLFIKLRKQWLSIKKPTNLLSLKFQADFGNYLATLASH